MATGAVIEYGALAVAAIATAGETAMQIRASNASEAAQESQAKSEETQNQLKILKQKNQEMAQVHVQLANNQAAMSKRGLSGASPSFNAIQMDTLNKTEKALQEGTTAMQVNKLNTQSEMESIKTIGSDQRSGMWFKEAGNLAELGYMGYKMDNPAVPATKGASSVPRVNSMSGQGGIFGTDSMFNKQLFGNNSMGGM